MTGGPGSTSQDPGKRARWDAGPFFCRSGANVQLLETATAGDVGADRDLRRRAAACCLPPGAQNVKKSGRVAPPIPVGVAPGSQNPMT